MKKGRRFFQIASNEQSLRYFLEWLLLSCNSSDEILQKNSRDFIKFIFSLEKIDNIFEVSTFKEKYHTDLIFIAVIDGVKKLVCFELKVNAETNNPFDKYIEEVSNDKNFKSYDKKFIYFKRNSVKLDKIKYFENKSKEIDKYFTKLLVTKDDHLHPIVRDFCLSYYYSDFINFNDFCNYHSINIPKKLFEWLSNNVSGTNIIHLDGNVFDISGTKVKIKGPHSNIIIYVYSDTPIDLSYLTTERYGKSLNKRNYKFKYLLNKNDEQYYLMTSIKQLFIDLSKA